MRSREGYRQSGDFDEFGEFGENDQVMTNFTIFGQRLRLEPNSPDWSKPPICRYPSLELIRSNLDLRGNIVKFAKFP